MNHEYYDIGSWRLDESIEVRTATIDFAMTQRFVDVRRWIMNIMTLVRED